MITYLKTDLENKGFRNYSNFKNAFYNDGVDMVFFIATLFVFLSVYIVNFILGQNK